MGCFVVARFLLIIASRGPSAVAELLVLLLLFVNGGLSVPLESMK